MEILTIYEKVNLGIPIVERRFFNYLNDTVDELTSTYNKFVLEEDEEYIPPKALTDEIAVRPLYASCIVDNILFLALGNEVKKTEFLRKAREIYHHYWSENAKGKYMKASRW